MNTNQKKLIFKTAIFILSLSLGWWLIKSGYPEDMINAILPLKFTAEIIAGIFYTSFLTSPISLAMLVVLARENNPVLTALLAGFGAVLGDFLIVKFFRQNIVSELNLCSQYLPFQRINSFLKKFRISFIIPFAGAIIIASPFPDEIGLMMLGISKLSYREIAVLTYMLNTAGILLIVAPVNLLS